jgi:uncharacterized membrane protein YedE/YeeE
MDMSLAVFPTGSLSPGAGLGVALVLGLGFGASLERAGLGSARRLAGQFYARDFTVLKVMFTAIVTAMLGVFWLSRLGWIDPARIYVPETFILPQAVGGAVFGAGLAVAGLCPGTACVAAASGRRDGVAVAAGMLAGVLLFAEAFPLVARFYASTPRGALTLPDTLHVPEGAVVAGIVALALAAFAVAERVEAARAGGGR